jgi:hypothetical protein
MYFHNKLIWSHEYEYYSVGTWSNVNYFFWHATHSCMFPGQREYYVPPDSFYPFLYLLANIPMRCNGKKKLSNVVLFQH